MKKDKIEYFVHPCSIIESGAQIGAGTKIWHFTHIMSGAVIGPNCTIGQNVFVGNNVVIGAGVKIQNNVSVYDGVIIEDNVFIGPSVVFTNVLHPRSFIEQKDNFQKTLIKKGATIGANATILCGLSIGKYAVIGAGSVLTKFVNDFELWIGNPALKTANINKDGQKV